MKRFRHKKRLTRQVSEPRRKGASAVECAFCMPIVLLITLGTLEITSGVFLQEALTVVAFEGARVGVRRKATRQAIIDTCEELLEDRGISEGTVTVTPDSFWQDADETIPIPALTNITVTVSAPTNGNTNYFLGYMLDRDASASVTMVREFDE